MNLPLLAVIVSALALLTGVVFTYRGFKASDRDTSPDKEGGDTAQVPQAAVSRHDHATTELLKRFFDGKACAICKQPIPSVHRTGLKPGLLNPETHETYSWDEIPTLDLSATLEKGLPVCSACRVAESFRERFPGRFVDRQRSLQETPPA